MSRMHLDHLSYAAGPEGMAETTQRISARLGERFVDGGVHPRFGTTNMILPLTGGRYLEVVEVLDHPASDKAPFGQATRALSQSGGGWLGWVVRVDDIGAHAARLGRTATDGNRHRPDGTQLRWRQFGTSNLRTDPQLPVLIQWTVPSDLHPSSGASGDLALTTIDLAGDGAAVDEWLGGNTARMLGDVDVVWADASGDGGRRGVRAASFRTPGGVVRI